MSRKPLAKYTVGYAKPPKETRFQKGTSGNPAGRPKGSPNLATALVRTLKEPVVITEHGRQKTITKFEAAVKQLVNKAASGEGRAIAHLLALVQVVESQVPPTDRASQSLPEADRQVMTRILNRFTRLTSEGGPSHGTQS